MSDELVHELPEATRLALASAREGQNIWLAQFAFDARIGGYVLGAQEPVLAQMRLAWWRDQLAKPASARPRGDLLLDLIGRTWDQEPGGLQGLLDGWESLLGEAPLGEDGIRPFLDGRAGAAAATARLLGHSSHDSHADQAARIWALADLAYRLPGTSDRELAMSMASAEGELAQRLPRALRPLAVLAGLSRRALVAGGGPLIGDRLSPLVALRLGMFGR